MKKVIFVAIIIMFLIACTPEQELQPVIQKPAPVKPLNPTPTAPPAVSGQLAKDQVDIIPNIDISQCLSQIRIINPEMPAQQANDNCFTLEAVNKNDQSICNQVSADFKQTCLSQFQ